MLSCGACFICSILPRIISQIIEGSDLAHTDFVNVVGFIAIIFVGIQQVILGLLGLATGSIILFRNRKRILDNYHHLVFSFAIILCMIIGLAFPIISCKIMSFGSDLGLFYFLDYIDLIIDLLS